MKREGYLFEKICSVENLRKAEKNARRGKSKQKGVRLFDLDSENKLIHLHHLLLNGEYKTSPYQIFKLFDGKEREIFKLPYFPDRIVHHGILNIIGNILVRNFTFDTYSCIKKRGIHLCLKKLNKALKDTENTKYCLKIDIKKFYPSINNEILKNLLRRKFKDQNLLNLLYEIIDSNHNGLPIGNYASQTLANFYLSGFDHYLKEKLKIKRCYRYCDDIVILGNNKDELRDNLINIIDYLTDKLDLKLSNYQIFPTAIRGIDFLGYKSYPYKILIRSSIKNRFINMIKYNKNDKSIASYNGWFVHANCKNLTNKYLNDISGNY